MIHPYTDGRQFIVGLVTRAKFIETLTETCVWGVGIINIYDARDVSRPGQGGTRA